MLLTVTGTHRKQPALLRACLAEFIGTFSLVFAGTGAIIVDDLFGVVTHVGVALTFGLIVMCMIYALGNVSGAQLNPAVTMALWLAGRLPATSVLPFSTAQVLGAFAASGLLAASFPAHETLGATLPAGSWTQAFVFEFIATLILMLVILRVTAADSKVLNFAGMVIGATVALEALFVGPVTGASMNPARSLAPAVLSNHLAALWIYLTATVLGAATAVALNKFLENESYQPSTPTDL